VKDLSPRCPACDQPPIMRLADDQAFCGNDDCHVLIWNPLKDLAGNLAGANWVDLEGGSE
jgi:hypothetical protein